MMNYHIEENTSENSAMNLARLVQLGEAIVDNRSVTEFAAESGISRTIVSRLLNGTLSAQPNKRTLRRLALASKREDKSELYRELLTASGYNVDARCPWSPQFRFLKIYRMRKS